MSTSLKSIYTNIDENIHILRALQNRDTSTRTCLLISYIATCHRNSNFLAILKPYCGGHPLSQDIIFCKVSILRCYLLCNNECIYQRCIRRKECIEFWTYWTKGKKQEQVYRSEAKAIWKMGSKNKECHIENTLVAQNIRHGRGCHQSL